MKGGSSLQSEKGPGSNCFETHVIAGQLVVLGGLYQVAEVRYQQQKGSGSSCFETDVAVGHVLSLQTMQGFCL